METITTIFSVNINGLNSPRKRRETFSKLQKEKADIIVLQETHIKEKKYLDIRISKDR